MKIIRKVIGKSSPVKILAVISAIILVTIISYNISSISIDKNYEALLTQTVDYQELDAVNNFFRYPENIINILSKNKDLPKYDKNNRLLKISILSLFESIIIGDPRISNIYYVSNSGEAICYKSKDDFSANYTGKAWYKTVIEAKPKISWLSHKSDFTGSDVVSCLQQVADIDGSVKGVIGLDIELFKLSENIKIGEKGYSMVLDADNKIIAHPDYNYLGQYISSDQRINMNNAYGKSFIMNINNERYKCKVLPVNKLPSWKFVNAIPVSEITHDKIASVIWPILLSLGCLTIVIVIYLRHKETQLLNHKLTDANEKLMQYSSTIEELAVSRERNRLARDVHDTLGQTLSLLITLLQVCIVSCKKDSEETEAHLIKAVNITNEGLKEVRRSISGLVPEKLEDNNLFDALNGLVTDFESLGMNIELSVNKFDQNLDSTYSEAIYRICQEALTNSVKHGKATEVSIIIKFTDNVIKLFIFDNGLGCKSMDSESGFGLKGMKQRIEKLHGDIKFGSSGEQGFNIHVELPLQSLRGGIKND